MNLNIDVISHNPMSDKNLPKLVVVVPTLNEEESIGIVLNETSEALSSLNYSVVVVNGHSTDGTCEIARNKGAIVIEQRGIGYGDALLTGFQYSREILHADVIAMIDADMSYDPKDIPSLMGLIDGDKADLVVGNRFKGMEKRAMPFLNKIGNRFLSWVARMFLRIRISDTQCGLRVFRADLLDHLYITNEGMPFAIEMLAEAKFFGARIKEIPVSYRPRIGTPKLYPLKDGLKIFGTILRLMRDTQPLLFFGGIGIILGVAGLFLGLDITLTWIKTGTVTRIAATILSVLLIFMAIQFITLSLIADMIKKLKKRR